MTINYNRMEVLIVEDDEDDYILLKELLEEAFGAIGKIDWAEDFSSARLLIKQSDYQMYFIDNRLGAELGLDLILSIKQKYEIAPPIIMLSGVDDRRTDIKAMNYGADDYLIKSQLSPLLLERTVRYILNHKIFEEKLNRLAHYDALTGLYNRSIFNELMSAAIEESKRTEKAFALVTIDLDDFKYVNDNYGHPAGDLLLTKVARRLKHSVRSADIVARLGGDEFSLLIKNVENNFNLVKIIETIMRVFDTPIQVRGKELTVSISAGIAIYPHDAIDSRELIEHSDRAMYQAKDKGKNTYSFYNQDLHQQAKNRHSLELKLTAAIQQNSLILHYQPILTLASQKIICFEALLRFRDEQGEFYNTEELISIAEQSPLINDLGLWVFDAACAQLMKWQQGQQYSGKIAINVSPKQFKTSAFTEHVLSVVKQYPQLCHKLIFELTERDLLDDQSTTIERLQRLVDVGCEFSLDDFGTGHSSLTYLRTLPLTIIKIDKSIVQKLLDDPRELALCKAIITMAQALDIDVVAEGIESQQIAKLLESLDCPQVQGYSFARPKPADQLEFIFSQPPETST